MPLFFYSRLLAFNHTENADILTMIQSFLCIFFSFNLKIFLVFCVFNLTFYSWGVSNNCKVEKLNQLIRGWINYFKIGSMKTLCKELDSRIRYRLRMCIWKQWKTPQNREKNLVKLGINRNTARRVAYTGKRIAYVCNKGAVNVAISNKRLASFGLISMLDYYAERCVTC